MKVYPFFCQKTIVIALSRFLGKSFCYNKNMILTKSEAFSKDEIIKLSETFEIYIKTVIDLKKKVCSAGCDLHADSEKILLEQGSKQEDLWGGGINLETKEIDYNSFINICPDQGNTSIELQDKQKREEFAALTKYFFKQLYE